MFIIGKAKTGEYKFSTQDFLRYLQYAESPGPENKFPQLIKIDEDMLYVKFKIGSFSYYWPRDVPMDGVSWMYQEVFEPASNNSHAYEYEELRINEGDIVVDVGACEGFFTRYALEKGATVIAIEPVKILSDALEKTFSEEIERGQVTVINAAIGLSKKTGYISSSAGNIFESHLCERGDNVNIITLDDLLTRGIDLIKMDIEGAEIDALFGAAKMIRQFKPKLSVAVYHKYENAQIIIDYLHKICPEYIIKHRGIFAYNNEKPRPMMVYAWL
jgi:FkbM family methyltransferase